MGRGGGYFWLGFRLSASAALWPSGAALVLSMHDSEGRMLSYLNTDDPVDHPRVRVRAADEGARLIREIYLDLVPTTMNTVPLVMSLTCGVLLPMGCSLRDFAESGGTVELMMTPTTLGPVSLSPHTSCIPVRDFPLKWLGDKNACVVGNLLRNVAIANVAGDLLRHPPKLELLDAAEVLPYWHFRYSSAVPLVNQVADILALFFDEAQHNAALVKHKAFAGCTQLNRLYAPKARQFASDIRKQEAAERLDAEERERLKILREVQDKSTLKKWTVADLPFDKISFMLRYLNQRQDLSDENVKDLWQMCNFLKMEAEYNDDELSIVGTLARKLEDFEELILNVYKNTALKTAEVKEIMSYHRPHPPPPAEAPPPLPPHVGPPESATVAHHRRRLASRETFLLDDAQLHTRVLRAETPIDRWIGNGLSHCSTTGPP